MEEGFIVSNKIRKAVFVEIASGEKILTRIIKKHHLIDHVARKSAEELINHKLIEKKNGEYKLTELGLKTYVSLKGSDSL